jgi:hypothetical protein
VVAFNGYTDRKRIVDLAIATDQRILGTIRKQLVNADQQADGGGNAPNQNGRAWMKKRP